MSVFPLQSSVNDELYSQFVTIVPHHNLHCALNGEFENYVSDSLNYQTTEFEYHFDQNDQVSPSPTSEYFT